ncbi:Altered inheritance of mitochondria protein 18 like [Verticillium longisporum]|uniref:Altered inheritance of mitochondria protein 18 like n=1 Tax=Verticillium longisporum TaxID=100787 RepID=A0A8I2ZVE7_VERLO|nr:Altered inheritance of mitochondria protein 18 like [Verticillium longisporum]KAG7138689.1 Altered inheritance of mitochondria protein 18 like [Verticillium longisporum]
MMRSAPLHALPRAAARTNTRSAPRRTFLRARDASRPLERLDIGRLSRARNDYDRDRTYFLAAGALAGAIGIVFTGTKLYKAIQAENNKKRKAAGEPAAGVTQLDAPTVPSETFTTDGGVKRKVVVHDEDGYEIVPTGNSTVPDFPRHLEVPSSRDASQAAQPIAATVQDDAGVEYTLVGLGLRTVSFLSIGVYIVGFYVATADIAKLQHHLVKKVNPIASTLIPSERDTLRQSLLDPAESEATWTALLQDLQCRSAFRIVPVRDTDFHHLRDAFVRAVQTRSNPSPQEFGDEAFGESVRTLKAIFNRGKLPKTRELLMLRDDRGALDVLYDDGKGRQPVGRVEDERVSRLLWLNYLAGKKVASEVARKNIIEGVMEFVERPVGTVATQVL